MTKQPPILLADWAGWHALPPDRQQPANDKDKLQNLRPDPLPAHVGLWLDRCLFEPKASEDAPDDHPGRRALYASAIEALDPVAEPPALTHYRTLFAAWERLARTDHPGVLGRVCEVRARSRVLLHPNSGASVTDGGILLHHSYGVPYLPGTALKGLCRAFADRLQEETGGKIDSPNGAVLPEGWIDRLFGHLPCQGDRGGEASLCDFWDALWVPPEPGSPGAESPLALDVVNPHHGAYYSKSSPGQDGERVPPKESDPPIPTHRLTIRPGARFLVRIESADDPAFGAWLDWILTALLLPALDNEGIGTRTTSGYGRLVGVDGPAGGGAAGGATPSERDLALISRTRNDGALHATFADGKFATLRGERARQIFQSLSDTVRGRIDRNKPTRLQVVYRKQGNAYTIEDIQETPTPSTPAAT